jgi:hypothetical protein
MNMKKRLVAALVFVLLFALVVDVLNAQENGPTPPPSDSDAAKVLHSAVEDMQCMVTFETELIKEITTLFPSLASTLDPKATTLKSDIAQLRAYENQNDIENFSIYFEEHFMQDLKATDIAIKTGIDSILATPKPTEPKPSNVSEGEGGEGMKPEEPEDTIKVAMDSLKEKHESLMSELNDCSAKNNHTGLVLDYYEKSLEKYEARAQDLNNRGIDASNLLDLVKDARSEILTPLQNKVKGANATELGALFSQYCLYDGCMNGTNFHMSMKFELLRMKDLYEVIAPEANAAGLGSNATAVKELLDSANAEIAALGTGDVTPEKHKAIWEDIRSAAKSLKELFVALKQ